MGYSKAIADAWKKYFEEEETQYEFDEEKGRFTLSYSVWSGWESWDCSIRNLTYNVFVKDDGFMILAVFPDVNTKPDCMTNTALLITYINSTLSYGSFDLDMDDGEVCFRLANYVPEGCVPDHDLCGKCVDRSLTVVRRYSECIFETMIGLLKDPKTAFERGRANE